ncbi:isoprenoid synthase domain-containing protein [Penicillium angulare]|uniref:isoprenoid synthase domain-containing protein n=1 Tax=Penicillium angulare TaxID=116970 RepID=UPI0025409937|nr:isoprenoid synthase domain-containing protein [Penicillium angulare]KAJ5281176.1 isoprenoid synthase domain-containing protein [Penicillium angulare]
MAENVEHRYSRALEPTISSTLPSFTSLPIRIREENLYQGLRARIRSSWMLVRHSKVHSSAGAECALGHIVSLVMPECPPERIDLATEVFDYAFIQNGRIHISSIYTLIFNKLKETDALETPESREAEAKSDQFDILAMEILGIEHPLTISMLSSVHEYLMTKHEAVPSFLNFEEYLKYRVTHVGSKADFDLSILSLMICILMDIPIGSEELENIHHIIQPLDEYFALCNDYFSYWKEKEDTRGGEYPSAIVFLMKSKGISEGIALEIVREKMISLEESHYSALRKTIAENALSLDQQRYIQYLQLAQGGAHAFSCTAYRYNPDAARRLGVDAKLETKRYVILMTYWSYLLHRASAIFHRESPDKGITRHLPKREQIRIAPDSASFLATRGSKSDLHPPDRSRPLLSLFPAEQL